MSGGHENLKSDYRSGLLSKDTPHERGRLGLLERWGDLESHAVLAQCGLTPASHCLEIGAGAGSVARWLAGSPSSVPTAGFWPSTMTPATSTSRASRRSSGARRMPARSTSPMARSM